jgi:uncharacterized protein
MNNHFRWRKRCINFEATTGPDSRWNQSYEKMVFPNRTEEDKKLLTYTSEPLKNDVEITGHPVVTLYVTSTANDGAFMLKRVFLIIGYLI